MSAARRHVTATLPLSAPADAVWKLISSSERVERWFEWVAETVVRAPGEGGFRSIHMKDGSSFDEYITLNDARSRTYQYYAPNPPLPIKHVIGTQRIELGPDGRLALSWFVSFDLESSAPLDITSSMRDLYTAALLRIDELARAPA